MSDPTGFTSKPTLVRSPDRNDCPPECVTKSAPFGAGERSAKGTVTRRSVAAAGAVDDAAPSPSRSKPRSGSWNAAPMPEMIGALRVGTPRVAAARGPPRAVRRAAVRAKDRGAHRELLGCAGRAAGGSGVRIRSESSGESERPSSTIVSRSGPSSRSTVRASDSSVSATVAPRRSSVSASGSKSAMVSTSRCPARSSKKIVSVPPPVVTKSNPPPGWNDSLASVPARTSRPGPPKIGVCGSPVLKPKTT